MNKEWVKWAVRRLEQDFRRSADTHLLKIEIPILSKHDIDLYLKDESTHPTHSLKHRLARSLFLYGICNGWITKDTPIIESSSGSTAVSEAYFAKLLGLRFIAVVPKATANEKICEIKSFSGEVELVEPSQIYSRAEKLAEELNGHYMDQFRYAERATDWRGNNNIAECIFTQMSKERFPTPRFIVVTAGTGGTSATIGRYIRYHSATQEDSSTELVVADPENSVFYDFFQKRDRNITCSKPSAIEGIGRPRVEESFIPDVIDQMCKVKDVDSIATIHFMEKYIGKKVGGSTGTNLYCVFERAAEMIKNGQKGSIVTLICDQGARYESTYYNKDWLKDKAYDIEPTIKRLNNFLKTGILS